MVKTTTRPPEVAPDDRAALGLGTASAAARNELPATLHDHDLDEELRDQRLRDRLLRDGDARAGADLAAAHTLGAVGLSAAVHAAVFASSPGTVGGAAGPVAAGPAIQRAAEPGAIEEDDEDLIGQEEPLQARVQAGPPPADPDDAPEDEEADPPAEVSARSHVWPTEVQREGTDTPTAYVYRYGALLPLQKKGGPVRRLAPFLPRSRSAGRPLPEAVRLKMEAAFGVDFTSVRVLEGPEAAAIGALAFTRGEQIFFAPGRYDPLSPAGQELLGHELAHVVQQRAGRVRPDGGGSPVNTSPTLEAEADRAGAAAARGQRAVVTGVAAGAQPKRGSGAVQLDRDLDRKVEAWCRDEQVGRILPDAAHDETERDDGKGVAFEKTGVSKKEERGTIRKDEIRLKSGVVLKDVSGSAVFRGDELVEFEGAATAIVPVKKKETFSFASSNLVVDARRGTVLSGDGEVTVLRSFVIGKKKGYTLRLDKGAKGTARIEKNVVRNIGGRIAMTLEDRQGRLLSLSFDGTVDPTDDVYSGTATAIVARRVQVLDGLGPLGEWSLWLAKGQKLEATLEKNRLTKLAGKLVLEVQDAEGPFLELEVEGHHEFGGKSDAGRLVANKGTVRLVRERVLLRLPELGWTVRQVKGLEASVLFTDNRPSGIAGTLPLVVADAKGDALNLSLEGSLTFDGVLTGKATVAIARPTPIGGASEGGGSGLVLEKGAGLVLHVDRNELHRIEGGAKATWSGVFREQPVVWAIDGSVDVDLRARRLTAAAGEVELKTPGIRLDDQTRLDGAKGTFAVDGGVLRRIDGTFAVVVFDEEGDLVLAEVTGTWEQKEGGASVSGTGKGTLQRDLEWVVGAATDTRVRVLKGSGGTATFEEGVLTAVSGTLSGEVLVGGTPTLGLELFGTYDVREKRISEGAGRATLLAPLALLDGRLTITGSSLTAELKDGELVRVGGQVEATVPDLKIDRAGIGFNWRTEGGEDKVEAWGVVDWTFFDDGDRRLGGKLDVAYREDRTFSARAAVQYRMNKYISGGGHLDVDERLEPEIFEAWLKYEQTLVEARDLFRLTVPILDLTIPIGIPGVNIEFGISMGTGLRLDPLQVAADVAIGDPWKLDADDEATRVPTFETTFTPTWGAAFDANVAAWLGLALGAAIAKVAFGAKGKVVLQVALKTDPEVTLGAGTEGFYGKMKVGAKVTPTLQLLIVPYTRASIPGIYEAEQEFDGFTHDLARFAGLDWGMEYAWGDRGTRATPHADRTEVGATGTRKDEVATGPVEAAADTGGAPAGTDGPVLDGSAIAGDKTAEAAAARGEGASSGKSKLDHVVAIAKGLGALIDLAELVGGAIRALMLGGPIGFAIWAAWNAFQGKLNWDDLKAKVQAVGEALTSIKELLGDKLNPTVLKIIDVLTGEVSIKDAIFGNKTKMRAEIAKGTHREGGPDERGGMINVLMGGLCGAEDEAAILEILYFSAGKGDLAKVLLTVDGGPDQVLWKLDGANEDAARRLFTANGIPMKEGFFDTSGSAKLAEQQIAEGDTWKKDGPRTRAGLIHKLADSNRLGKALEIVRWSQTHGDLLAVVATYPGGVEDLRSDFGQPSALARLEVALARAGNEDMEGVDPLLWVNAGAHRWATDAARGEVVKVIFSVWYMNEAEENAVLAILKSARSVSTIVGYVDGGAARFRSRITGPAAREVGRLVQARGNLGGPLVQARAMAGISGSGGPLPYLDTIQAAFGRHDVRGVRAHLDGAADRANAAMGSRAYATGDHVAFRGTPDLHTAAHEAAHTIQQKAGIQLKDGVGQAGDVHERHADAVADAVVQGRSAEALLDRYTGTAPAAAGDALPGDEGEAGTVQHRAEDTLTDDLEREGPARAPARRTPPPRTEAASRLAEHFDAVLDDEDQD